MAIFTKPPSRQYDVIVVGSGPAGMSFARRLSDLSDKKILIIESGRLKFSRKDQDLSTVISEGRFRPQYFKSHSRRVLGGTSTVWNGYCAVLEKKSFEQGKWPIEYDELSTRYPEAAKVLNIPDDVYLNPHYDVKDTNLRVKPYYFSPPKRFNDENEISWLKSSTQVDILFGFTVNKFGRKGSKITQVECASIGGLSAKYDVNEIVLACGGIGNVKLLWQVPNLNNSNLGSYFMEHPHIYNQVFFKLKKEFYENVRQQFSKKNKNLFGLSLSPDVTKSKGLLSGVFDIRLENPKGEPAPFMGEIHSLLSVKSSLRCEMWPVKENNILKTIELDGVKVSIPKVKLELNFDSINELIDEFVSELTSSGLGRALKVSKVKSGTGGGHLIGTTRMGKTEADSVIDGDCRVHGINNLYVLGSSIFPYGEAANPTLSIVAFSIRLAEKFIKF